MPVDLDDLLEGVRSSRRFFLKHLNGLTDYQWSWKPYPECKSALETLVHLRVDDLAALESLQTNEEPRYEELSKEANSHLSEGKERLLQLLEESHAQLAQFLADTYSGMPLDTQISVWGHKMPLARGVPYFSSEDFYHAGQIAFIRMATEPGWDYYAEIYGG